MLAKPTKVYSYQRVSSTVQKHGVGIQRQQEAAEKWCEGNGLALDNSLVLRDIGKSGGGLHKVKGVLGQFYKEVESGKIQPGSYLLIDDFSRLSREEISVACEDFLKLINAEIAIVCLSDNGRVYTKKNLDMPNLMVSIMMMSRAYEENAFKKRTAKDNWQRKVEQLARGEKISIKLPAWIEAIDEKVGTKKFVKEYRIVEKAADIVRLIFKLRLKGYSVKAIAKHLNKNGFKSFGKGLGWNDSQIREVLKHKSVIGILTFKGHEQDGYFEPIIAREDFEKVQAMFQETIRTGGRSEDANEVVVGNLFVGLAKCPHCGTNLNKMHSHRGGKYKYDYLTCYSYRREINCTNSAIWEYTHFEKTVLTYISDMLNVSDLLEDNTNQDEIQILQKQRQDNEQRIKYLQKSIDNWFEALAEYNGNNKKRYQETANKRIDEASDTIEELKRECVEIAARIKKLSISTEQLSQQLADMRRLIAIMNDEKPESLSEIRIMLQREINNLIDKIIVYPAGNPNDTTPDSVRFAGKKQKQGHKNWNYQKRYMDIYFKTGTIRSLVQMYEERWIAIDTKMSREDREGYEMILKEQNN